MRADQAVRAPESVVSRAVADAVTRSDNRLTIVHQRAGAQELRPVRIGHQQADDAVIPGRIRRQIDWVTARCDRACGRLPDDVALRGPLDTTRTAASDRTPSPPEQADSKSHSRVGIAQAKPCQSHLNCC